MDFLDKMSEQGITQVRSIYSWMQIIEKVQRIRKTNTEEGELKKQIKEERKTENDKVRIKQSNYSEDKNIVMETQPIQDNKQRS